MATLNINSSVKRKRANLKMAVTRKQGTPNFPKEKHWYPLICTPACVHQGSKKYPFFRKIGRALFSCNYCLKIHPFPWLSTNFVSWANMRVIHDFLFLWIDKADRKCSNCHHFLYGNSFEIVIRLVYFGCF